MFFAAVAHLDEGLSLEALLILKVEKSLSGLVGTWRPTVFITTITVDFVVENLNKK
jgi:hypothetical protein